MCDKSKCSLWDGCKKGVGTADKNIFLHVISSEISKNKRLIISRGRLILSEIEEIQTLVNNAQIAQGYSPCFVPALVVIKRKNVLKRI